MKAKSITKKELIMTLLKDHLVYSRLIQGLEKTGLETDHFDLYLSETIFTIMGFRGSEEDEVLFEKFITWSKEVHTINFSNDNKEALDELCKQIYRKLKTEKKYRKLMKKAAC